MPHSHYLKADAVLLLVTLLAAVGWVFSREALQGMPPMMFVGMRFLLAGAVLFAMSRRDWGLLGDRLRLIKILGTGGIMAAALVVWINGLAYGGHMGEGSFITSLGVVIVPLASWVLFREQVSRTTWLAIPVAVLGMACLALSNGFRFDPGQWFYLSAAVLFALHFSVLGQFAAKFPTMLLTSLQLLMVGIVSLTFSIALEQWPEAVSVDIWGWFLASALIATSLRFALQTYGQSLAPTSHVALIMILEPMWTTLCGIAVYSETMSPLQLTGCGLIFGAIIIGRWHWLRLAFNSVAR